MFDASPQKKRELFAVARNRCSIGDRPNEALDKAQVIEIKR